MYYALKISIYGLSDKGLFAMFTFGLCGSIFTDCRFAATRRAGLLPQNLI
jgi:hypothetical protein